MNIIRLIPADKQNSHGLVLMTLASFACQYAAMTQPGRERAQSACIANSFVAKMRQNLRFTHCGKWRGPRT
jgi:hypothetical protein